MVDRGFNVARAFKKKGVELIIPEFKGRDRLQIIHKESFGMFFKSQNTC